MTGRMLVAILVPVLLAVETMAWLADRWFADGSYFGHGPFVPITAAAWAAWIVRRERHLGGGSALLAIPVAAAAAIMLYVLHGRGVGFVGAVGWWLGTIALLLGALGWRGTRALVGPVGLLLFMLPWPLKLIEDLSLPLKTWSMEVGLLGAPSTVVREGARLLIPDGGVLVVGDVCSGLRSLVAMLAFGYVVAAMTRTTHLRRVAVFLLAAPVAVLINALRIHVLVRVAVGAGAEAAGPGTLVHDGSGIAAFVCGLFLLWGLARVLRRDVASPRPLVGSPPGVAWVLAALAVMALGPALAFVEADLPVGVAERDLLQAIPTQLRPPSSQEGPVIPGRDIPLAAGAARLLRPDGFLSRLYGERGTYHLCIVYGRSRRTRLHAPESCYRGNGWEVEAASSVRCPASFTGAPGYVREIQLVRGEERRLTWYWYRSGGVSTSAYGAFTWRALIDPGEPQILVWLSIPFDAQGLSRARERLRWFTKTLSFSLGRVLEGL